MHTTNKPPTPAAVRAAMKPANVDLTKEELAAWSTEDRMAVVLLRDHIRAVAADLRTQANICEEQEGSYLSPLMLRTFADKLEGKA